MNNLICSPASYTKPYPTTWDMVVKNWTDGKDFKVSNGPYFSRRDLKLLKDVYAGLVIYYRDVHGLQYGYLSLKHSLMNVEGL